MAAVAHTGRTRPSWVLRNGREEMHAVSILSPSFLATGSVGGTLQIWRCKTRRVVATVAAAHGGESILTIAPISANATRFLTHGRDGNIHFWEVLNDDEKDGAVVAQKVLTVYLGASGYGRACVHRIPDQERVLLAAPSEARSCFQLYHVPEDGEASASLVFTSTVEAADKRGMLMALNILDENHVVVGYESGHACLHHVGRNEEISCVEGHSDVLMCLDFVPWQSTKDDQSNVRFKGFSGGSDKVLSVYTCETAPGTDGSSGLTMTKIQTVELPAPGVAQIKVRPSDRRIVLVAGWDAQIRIFSVKRLRLLSVLSYHEETVHDVAFSSASFISGLKQSDTDGKDGASPTDHFFSAAKDGRVACWRF
jgi:WD40 repeat protein